MGLLPDVHSALFGSISPTDLIATAGRALLLGHVLWILAYGLILARSARAGLLGIPLAAIILNISWEALLYGNCAGVGLRDLCGPGLSGEWSLALSFILGLDILLLAQAFVLTASVSGPSRTALVFVVALVVVYVLHANLIGLTLDYRGLVDSWIMNAIMSALFVRLALGRPNGEPTVVRAEGCHMRPRRQRPPTKFPATLQLKEHKFLCPRRCQPGRIVGKPEGEHTFRGEME